jgi:autotransporter strand-loop-strand O-heptosyltransferase
VKPELILAHTSFLGHTGYANHSREFFTHLNKYIPVRVRNFAHVNDLSYLTNEQKDMVIYQTWDIPPYKVGRPLPDRFNRIGANILNIVLNETNHYFFYDNYKGPKIAYNVWESTRQPKEFFNRLLQYDQLWVPTEWQRSCTIDQGYPADKIRIVHEGVDSVFVPDENFDDGGPFQFMVFGRWDYRKSITEIIKAFVNEFDGEDVELIISVDNPFPVDNLKTTEERLAVHCGIKEHPQIRNIGFVSREDYVKWLQQGNCLVTCARSEGWNLPLIEAMACGTPVICSDWGAQLEFASGIANLVNIKGMRPPQNVFMHKEGSVPGEWAEPDFEHLQAVMREVYENYEECKALAKITSKRIRKKFSWETVTQQALKHIEEFENPHTLKTIDNPKIKLNLGCGNDIKEDYINVDYLNNIGKVDVAADVAQLPFKKNSIDEIYIAHVVEHFGVYEIPQVFNEFNRVLKEGARLIIEIPDLEDCVRIWQGLSDEEKYTRIEYIFGGQSHQGDYHKHGYSKGSLKYTVERYGFRVEKLENQVSAFGSAKAIYCQAIKVETKDMKNTKVNYHFVDGAFLEVVGNDTRDYDFIFFDRDAHSVVHRRLHQINTWTRPHRRWFTNWSLGVYMGNDLIFKHDFDAKGKEVMISFESKSLGDTIAWMPYCEEFRVKHRCNVAVSTFWNRLFQDVYPQIRFIKPGEVVNDLYASYRVGCWDDDFGKNKFDWRETPLQKIATDILGLEYEEIRPRIWTPDVVPRGPAKPVVTISEGATAGCKQWQYQEGWQQIVDYLNDHGYEVLVISKEPTSLKNVINMTNKPIEQTITNIKISNFFIGVSSGPAWLAWALNKPVIMISGCTNKWNEFQNENYRVINEKVCHGCFNNRRYKFDRGDWWWCPTGKAMECTKEITPKMVIEQIKRVEQNINTRLEDDLSGPSS